MPTRKGSEAVTLRLDRTRLEQLKMLQKRDDRSRAYILAKLVEEGLDRELEKMRTQK